MSAPFDSSNCSEDLPNAILSIDALTPQDKEDLNFGLEMNVDYVALSFVQKPEDIRHVASLLGYEDDMKIALLRQKALHDYQSLQLQCQH